MTETLLITPGAHNTWHQGFSFDSLRTTGKLQWEKLLHIHTSKSIMSRTMLYIFSDYMAAKFSKPAQWNLRSSWKGTNFFLVDWPIGQLCSGLWKPAWSRFLPSFFWSNSGDICLCPSQWTDILLSLQPHKATVAKRVHSNQYMSPSIVLCSHSPPNRTISWM